MSDGLKTCPFCGGEAKLRQVKFGMEKIDRYGAVCQACFICLGWFETEEEARGKWNRRVCDDGQ